jgi:hypothetical protein
VPGDRIPPGTPEDKKKGVTASDYSPFFYGIMAGCRLA